MYLNKKEVVQLYERWFAEKWGHGFVDIMQMNKHNSKRKEYKDKPIDNVGAYLSKYFSKSADDERLEGHKIFLPSKGLDRPIEYKGEEAENILKYLELDKKNKVFQNEYPSEYLGQITFKEYNLIRE